MFQLLMVIHTYLKLKHIYPLLGTSLSKSLIFVKLVIITNYNSQNGFCCSLSLDKKNDVKEAPKNKCRFQYNQRIPIV